MHALDASLCLLACLFTLVILALTPSGGAYPSSRELTADEISCLQDSNITLEEVQNTTFFHAKIKISHEAMCFAACLISTDYNVSISSDGILKKEGILIETLMEGGLNKKNATELIDTCMNVVFSYEAVCVNLYNYVSCINQKYFEKVGIKALGNILDQDDTPGNHSNQKGNPGRP